MTALQAAQLVLAWLAVMAAITAVVSRRASRSSWAAAGLLVSGWLALTESALVGATLAAGTLVAVTLEGPSELGEADFSRTTRRLGLLAVGLAVAMLVLVTVAQVDASKSPYVFPVLATGVISLIVMFAADEESELHHAVRLLLLVAAAGWTVATGGAETAAGIAAAVALPLTALPGWPRPPGERGAA